MTDLDRLIAEEQARATAERSHVASNARNVAAQTEHAYGIVESVLREAAEKRDPWALISKQDRLRLGLLRSLPSTPPVCGWVFPFSPGWGQYGMALTVGGRIVLMYFNEGNEKHQGRVSMLHDPYPPHGTWPKYQSLRNADGVMRYGAEGFPEAVARAIVTGDTWHTPVWGRHVGSGRSEDAADFVRHLAPRLASRGGQASDI